MKRSPHHTAWAGALAVAAELSRHGYDAALTFGNTPTLDLLCASPNGIPFKMQVKSLTTGNAVLIGPSMLATQPDGTLFFAVVIVPPQDGDPLQFRILTHDEVLKLGEKMPKAKPGGQPYKKFKEGLNWGLVKPYYGGWDKLPK